MDDADDSGPDTPGTDQEEINEDARMLGNEPSRDAIDEPTQTEEQEAREGYWLLKETVAISIASIFGVLLLVVGLMLASGLVTIPEPIGASPIGHWSVFIVLGVILVAAFVWSQWGT